MKFRIASKLRSVLTEPFSSAVIQPEHQIVFVRHGESEWVPSNRFCGWYDAPLNNTGRETARRAAKLLKASKLSFDKVYTSCLARTIETASIILKALDQEALPIERSWRLNDRHLGNLTGMDKAEAAELFGAEKLNAWRRAYDRKPPPLLNVNPYYRQVADAKRFDITPGQMPLHESLKDTVARVLPLWTKQIATDIKRGKLLLVVGHEDSLRSIVKHVEGIDDGGVRELRLPVGLPFIYTLGADLKAHRPSNSVRFMGNKAEVVDATQMVERAKHPPPKQM